MATNLEKARDTYELFEFCREDGGHTEFLRRCETAQRYWASRQWSDEDFTKRVNEGRLAFTVNEVFRVINSLNGEMAQLSSDVRYDPLNGDVETSQVLNKLAEHVDRMNRTYILDDIVRLHGLLLGRGFYEYRMVFDENMQGDIRARAMRPQNVVLDAYVDSIDPNDWNRVFTTEIVSADDVANLYNVGKDGIDDMVQNGFADWLTPEDRTLAQSIGYNRAYAHGGFDVSNRQIKQFRLINHQYRELKYKDFFVDLQTGDMSEIPETWPREKVQFALDNFGMGTTRRKAMTVRWRVTCNNIVLHDEDSPYKHFTVVPYMPYFLDGHAMSLFDVLKGPQDLLNYTVSEEAHILGTTSHSGWKIKQGSLKNMSMRELELKGSSNGLILELEDPADAERITPGQPATGMERMGDRSRGWLSELAGVTPSMAGNARADASGRGIEAQLKRAPVNLSGPLTAFQFAKHVAAEIKLNLFQTFYTETRIMRIATGPYGQTAEVGINMPDAYGRIVHDLSVGKYTTRMLPTGSRQAADEFAFDELMQLKEIGINVPNSLFIAVSSIQAKSDVIEQLIAANNGDLSPEEERAKQIELATMEAELEDLMAGIDAKKAQRILSLARADRAMADAQYDPRKDRNQLDRGRLMLEHQRQMRQLDLTARKQNQDSALGLLKIGTSVEIAEKKNQAAKKQPAKKAVKKATTKRKQPR